jgi:hypothetical protein
MLDNINIYDGFENVPHSLSEARNINVYPNPFSIHTIIHSNYLFKNAIVIVYDFFGQIVKKQDNINGSIINFDRENLASGIYFLTVKENNKIVSSNKIVIAD